MNRKTRLGRIQPALDVDRDARPGKGLDDADARYGSRSGRKFQLKDLPLQGGQ